MSGGKARNILVYDILLAYAQKLNRDTCFYCGEKITSSKELAVGHKIPFLYSDDPKGLFFDLNNVAFCHRKCNCANSRTLKENQKKSINSKIGTVGYKGVRFRKDRGTYYSRITIDGKEVTIGSGRDPKALAELYDQKAIELLGEDAITNKKLGLL